VAGGGSGPRLSLDVAAERSDVEPRLATARQDDSANRAGHRRPCLRGRRDRFAGRLLPHPRLQAAGVRRSLAVGERRHHLLGGWSAARTAVSKAGSRAGLPSAAGGPHPVDVWAQSASLCPIPRNPRKSGGPQWLWIVGKIVDFQVFLAGENPVRALFGSARSPVQIRAPGYICADLQGFYEERSGREITGSGRLQTLPRQIGPVDAPRRAEQVRPDVLPSLGVAADRAEDRDIVGGGCPVSGVSSALLRSLVRSS
jgi:hypothetical protein